MEFKIKSADELKALSNEELMGYWVSKLSHEKSVTDAKIKELEAKADGEEVEAVKAEIKAAKEAIQATLVEHGLALNAVKSGKISGAQMSQANDIISAALIENRDNFVKCKNGRHDFKFEIKAVGNMTFAGNVTGVMPQAERLSGVNNIAERVAITYNLVPKLNTSKNVIEWVYESGQEGTIDGTAEGAAKDQIDNDFVVTSVSLVKRAAFMKASTEMLDDVDFMNGWLRNKLVVRLFLDIDNQTLNGDGTGNNVNGIIAQATTFAAGTFATSVDNANDVDSLMVAINQIKIANQLTGNLQIMMHPSDVTALALIKLSATDKRYLFENGRSSVMGVPIIENVNITAGDFLVGDFSKATIVQKSGISVEVGLDADDFTKNLRTILVEWRGQLFVQNNDTTAFVKGTFATTNAALETP